MIHGAIINTQDEAWALLLVFLYRLMRHIFAKFPSGIGVAFTVAQGNMEPSFKTAPPVQTLKLKRVDDKLLAMWSPPDLTSLGLTNSILEKMRAGMTYHICVEKKSQPSWSNVEAFKCDTKQRCYLFKPESPFEKYRVKVTWNIPNENLFQSVRENTSEVESLCKCK